jgi:hypothetical protein
VLSLLSSNHRHFRGDELPVDEEIGSDELAMVVQGIFRKWDM